MARTHACGNAFEHFIILESLRLGEYHSKDYQFKYLRTSAGAHIDLVVKRQGLPLLCFEIKSSRDVTQEAISTFKEHTSDILNCEAVVFSQDKYAKKFEHVTLLPWREALNDLF